MRILSILILALYSVMFFMAEIKSVETRKSTGVKIGFLILLFTTMIPLLYIIDN